MLRTHWGGLDGLRGIAVLVVVLFHADVQFGVNGYVGVDVFFTLSGFLITTLLLEERLSTGRIALGRFAMRRLLRLYPALVVVCLAVLGLSVVAHRLAEVAAAVAVSLVYLSNWWLYTGHDMVLLNHLWTLAIEEHFYLVWPTLLTLGLSKRRGYRVAAGCATAVVVLLLAVPWPAVVSSVKDSYVRGAPILFGCLVAFVLRSAHMRPILCKAAAALGLLGALLIVVVALVPSTLSPAYLEGLTSTPGWAAGGVIIAVVLTPTSLSVRWLRFRPLTWCGRRAYGIYLIHFPVLSLMAHQVTIPSSHLARVVIGAALSFALAAISYRFVELPFLRLKSRYEPSTARPAKVT